VCKRCASTGRRCDGYIGSSLSRRPTGDPNELCAVAQCIPYLALIPTLPFESIEEQENLHFFQNYALPEMTGIFTSDFWQREILQAAQIQPAIRHSITALGAMHRRHMSGTSSSVPDDSSDAQLCFALHQSNRAIQEITRNSADRTGFNLIAVMTCCILFNCLSCLQGHQQDAINHLRSGIKLLKEFDDSVENGASAENVHPVSSESIRKVFITLTTQARGVMCEGDILNWEPQPKRSECMAKFMDTTTSFPSASSAQLYLETIFNDIVVFLQDVSLRSSEMGDIKATSLRLQHESRISQAMLDEFLASASFQREYQRDRKFAALRLTQILIKIFTRALKEVSDGMLHDGGREGLPGSTLIEEEDFDTITTLSSQLIEPDPNSLEIASYAQPARRPVFTANFGIVMCLWVVATRAPDYNTRRRAIKLLLENPRRDGVWDGPLAGKIALEGLTLVEETRREQLGMSCSDPGSFITHETQIPPELRMSDISIRYTGLREGIVEYRNAGHLAKKEQGWIKQISW